MLSQEELEALKAKQKEKEEYFAKIKKDIREANAEKLKSDINEALSKGYRLPEIEYSSIGAEEYGFYYHAVRMLNDLASAAYYKESSEAAKNALKDYKDVKRVERVHELFETVITALYDAGVRPDVKSMTTLAALATGSVDKDIYVINKLAPYGEMFEAASLGESFRGYDDIARGYKHTKQYGDIKRDNFNSTMYTVTNDNMVYPFYMQYMRFSLVQRCVFDQLVWFAGFTYEHNMSNRNRDYNRLNTVRAYKSYDLQSITHELVQEYRQRKKPDSIRKAKQLDKYNMRLAHLFDYLLKSKIAHGTVRFAQLPKRYMEAYDFFLRDLLGDQMAQWKDYGWTNVYNYYKNFPNTSKFRREGFDFFIRSNVPKKLLFDHLPEWRDEMSPIMLRLGFALTHPSTLSRYDSLRFADTPENAKQNETLRKELEYFTDMYMQYKKEFFKGDTLELKPINEIMKIRLPVWSQFVFAADCAWLKKPPIPKYEQDYNAESAMLNTFDQLPDNFCWIRFCNPTDLPDDYYVRNYCIETQGLCYGKLPDFFDYKKFFRQDNDNSYWCIADESHRVIGQRASKFIKAFVAGKNGVGMPVDYHPLTTELTLLQQWVFNMRNRENENQDIAELLLAAGADPNVEDKAGRNVLYLAIQNGFNVEVVESIIKRTTDINHRDKHGYTIFSMAAYNYISTAISAKKHKGDFRIVNQQLENYRQICRLLLKNGADPYLDASWQRTERDSTIFEEMMANPDDFVLDDLPTSDEMNAKIIAQATANVRSGYDQVVRETVLKECLELRPDLPYKEYQRTEPPKQLTPEEEGAVPVQHCKYSKARIDSDFHNDVEYAKKYGEIYRQGRYIEPEL